MIATACPRCPSGRLLSDGTDYSCLACGHVVYTTPIIDVEQAESEMGPPKGGGRKAWKRQPKHGNIRL